MPFRLDYEDPIDATGVVGGIGERTGTGAHYPESWWVLDRSDISHGGRYATFVFHGFVSQALKDEGAGPFATRVFAITDPAVFETQIAPIIEQIVTGFSFQGGVEVVILFIGDFFDTAEQFAVVRPLFGEVGNQSNVRVVVTMNQSVTLLSGGWDDGVTIKVNGVEAAIAAADQNPFETTELRFDLADFVSPGDSVTWEYDESAGQIRDLSNLPMASIAPLVVTNNVVPVSGACVIAAVSSVAVTAQMTLAAIATIQAQSTIAVSGGAITRNAAASIGAESGVAVAAEINS